MSDSGLLGRLEQYRGHLLLIAGLLLLCFAGIRGTVAFMDYDASMWLTWAFSMPATAIGLLGMMGFYRSVKADVAIHAGVGAAIAGIAAVGATAVIAMETVNVAQGSAALPAQPIYMIVLLATMVAYLAIGTVCVRTSVPSTRGSLIVLLPGLVYLSNVAAALIVGPGRPESHIFLFASLQTAAHLLLAGSLLTGGDSTVDPATETAAT